MRSGKVLTLYMTMPDMMRSGHRMRCDDFECNPNGIVGDVNYEKKPAQKMLLVSKKSYDIIEDEEIAVSKGLLLENIYVDIDLNNLKQGSIIEVGDVVFTVDGPCESYGYLYAIAPELPELIHGNRGIFITPCEHGKIEVGDEVKVIEEA